MPIPGPNRVVNGVVDTTRDAVDYVVSLDHTTTDKEGAPTMTTEALAGTNKGMLDKDAKTATPPHDGHREYGKVIDQAVDMTKDLIKGAKALDHTEKGTEGTPTTTTEAFAGTNEAFKA